MASERMAKVAATRAGWRHATVRHQQALIADLLRRQQGATLDELIAATGWLPHTTRAALTGLRRKGCTLEKSSRAGGKTAYRSPVSIGRRNGSLH